MKQQLTLTANEPTSSSLKNGTIGNIIHKDWPVLFLKLRLPTISPQGQFSDLNWKLQLTRNSRPLKHSGQELPRRQSTHSGQLLSRESQAIEQDRTTFAKRGKSFNKRQQNDDSNEHEMR